MLFIDLFTFYFLITSLFGYVQLKENSLFIKFGLILNKEIPYDKIKELIDIDAVKNFRTINDWESYNWLENYQNSTFKVNVDISIKTGNLLTQE